MPPVKTIASAPSSSSKISTEVMADGGDEHVDRQQGSGVSLVRGFLDIAEVASGPADAFQARLVGQDRQHFIERLAGLAQDDR